MTTDLAQRFDAKVAEAIKKATAMAPYSSLLGLRIEEARPGELVCSLPIRPELLSGPLGVHGGAIASLIDHTLSLTVWPVVERGSVVTTSEFKLNYLESVSEGVLRATGTILSLRKRAAVVRVDVTCEGKLIATALGTLVVRDRPAA